MLRLENAALVVPTNPLMAMENQISICFSTWIWKKKFLYGLVRELGVVESAVVESLSLSTRSKSISSSTAVLMNGCQWDASFFSRRPPGDSKAAVHCRPSRLFMEPTAFSFLLSFFLSFSHHRTQAISPRITPSLIVIDWEINWTLIQLFFFHFGRRNIQNPPRKMPDGRNYRPAKPNNNTKEKKGKRKLMTRLFPIRNNCQRLRCR